VAYAIETSHLGKVYRLGSLTTSTLRTDISRWWSHRARQTTLQGAESQVDGEYWALRDVSFQLQHGEVLGIVGRNGAGKSTLLKLLSQVTAPSTGRIRLQGRLASLLEVGTGFHPDLTGRENVYMNGAILGMTKAEIRRNFDEIVAFSECEAFIDTPVKRYSSGMYVRLAFAVAAHLEPEILIVDEVLAVGDSEFQGKCLGKMRDVSSHGRTVLFVSHSMAAVGALCTRAIMLKHGRLAMEGSTEDVIAAYQHESMTSAPQESSLLEVPRTGTGKGRFRSIHVEARDRDGNKSLLVPGSDVVVEVELEAHRDFNSANVALTVHESGGVRLVDAGTAIQGEFLSLRAGERATVTFVLRDLRLKPGRYPVSLHISRAHIEEIDTISCAHVLEVLQPTNARHSEEFPGLYQCAFEHHITVDDQYSLQAPGDRP
jgi:lipopolysaccharide transport system ATP-binding protein